MGENLITLKWIRGNTGCLVMPELFVPVYRLDETRVVLLDSGFPQNAQSLLKTLEEAGLRAAYVLTSHIHIDHIGAHTLLKQRHNAVIYTSEYDAPACCDLLMQKSYMGLDVPESLLQTLLSFLAVRPDHTFRNTDSWIDIENARFRVLQLPGHTPSHIGFVTPDGVAYLGDALVKPTDRLPSELSYKTAIQTIRHLPELEYPCFIAAHAGIFEQIDDLVEKNLEIFRSVGDAIMSQCATPLTKGELPGAVMAALNIHPKEPLFYLSFETVINRFLTYLIEEKQLCYKLENGQLIIQREKTPGAENHH